MPTSTTQLISEVLVKDSASAPLKTIEGGFKATATAETNLTEQHVASARGMDQMVRQLERLKIASNEEYAAEVKRAQAMATVTKAQQFGILSQEQSTILMGQVIARTNDTEGAFGRFGRAAEHAGLAVGALSLGLGSGERAMHSLFHTAGMVAFSFGPWGIAIGAALTGITALAERMGLFNENIGVSSEEIKALGLNQKDGVTASDLYTAAIDRANAVLLTSAQRARDAADAQLTLAQKTAQASLQAENFALGGMQQKRGELGALAQNPSRFSGVLTPALSQLDSDIERERLKVQLLEKDLSDLNNPAKVFPKDAKTGGTTAGGRVASTQAISDQSSALQQLLDKMAEENRLLGESERQRAIDTATREAQDAAIKDGNLLTQQQIANVQALAAANFDLSQQTKATVVAAKDSKISTEQLSSSLNQLGQSLTGAANGSINWSQVMVQGLNLIADAIAQLAKIDTSQSGGGLSGLISGLLTSIIGSSFGGSGGFSPTSGSQIFAGHASGGFMNAGDVGIVGERGPELFRAPFAGNVVPNGKWGKGGDTYNIYAPGADAAGLARVENFIRQVNGSIEKRSVSAVMEAKRRGGDPGQVLSAA